MATSLVPGGVYKIRNSQFTLRVVELVGGEIVGYQDSKNLTNKWQITDVGAGGDRVIMESVVAPGTFAHAHQAGGARIIPSTEKTVWGVIKADGNKYIIQSENSQLVWELPDEANKTPILLTPHTGQEKTKWWFERVYI